MPDTTPEFAFPYPLGADALTDGDNVIRALAERMEAVLHATEWVYPALNSGFDTGGAGGEVAYRKDGAGNVHVEGVVGSTGTPTTAAFTLPPGFRPVTGLTGGVQNLIGGAVGSWAAAANGDVTVGPMPGNYAVNIVFSTTPR